MQVILVENVENLGKQGDVVNVKDGFGRNYLIQRGLAVAANTGNTKQLEHQKKLIQMKKDKTLKDAESLKHRLESLSLTVEVQVGEEDKIFGTITNTDIAKALEKEGIVIDKHKIIIDEPVRALGMYNFHIKLSAEIIASVKVFVVKSKH